MRVRKPLHSADLCVAVSRNSLQLWHERLGHQNKAHLKNFLKLHEIDVNVTEELCDGYAFEKQHRRGFRTRKDWPTKPGEIFHADLAGQMQEKSLGGARYFLCLKDDFSKFRRVFFLK